MAVTFIKFPFPLAVGFSAISLVRITKFTRPLQLQGFMPSMRIDNFWPFGFQVFGCLSSSRISNWKLSFLKASDFYGFLVSTIMPASRHFPLLTFDELLFCKRNNLVFRVFQVKTIGEDAFAIQPSIIVFVPAIFTLVFKNLFNSDSGLSTESFFCKKPIHADTS